MYPNYKGALAEQAIVNANKGGAWVYVANVRTGEVMKLRANKAENMLMEDIIKSKGVLSSRTYMNTFRCIYDRYILSVKNDGIGAPKFSYTYTTDTGTKRSELCNVVIEMFKKKKSGGKAVRARSNRKGSGRKPKVRVQQITVGKITKEVYHENK